MIQKKRRQCVYCDRYVYAERQVSNVPLNLLGALVVGFLSLFFFWPGLICAAIWFVAAILYFLFSHIRTPYRCPICGAETRT